MFLKNLKVFTVHLQSILLIKLKYYLIQEIQTPGLNSSLIFYYFQVEFWIEEADLMGDSVLSFDEFWASLFHVISW